MTPHHIGCIVPDIDEAVASHLKLHHGSVSEKILVTTQKVWVCFAELHHGFYIEFVQANGEGSAIDALKKKGATYYHIGYKTPDINASIEKLEGDGYRLLNRFSSEAFGGKECAFLFGNDGRLLELIQE